MRPNYKPKFTNRPKHIQQDNSFYFFTVRTIDGQWFLKPDKYKKILLNIINEKTKKFNYSLIAYVILQNHYHLMIKITDANKISKFIGEVNGSSARLINKADSVYGRKIWWNYFDHIIRNESDFFKHLNYIHQNPIKHRITSDFDYRFSSYNLWVRKKGKEYLDQAFEKYPIIDFVMKGDEF
jgi:putative transposase